MQRIARSLIDTLGRMPLIGAPIRRRAWYPWRYRWVLHTSRRENVTFTQFMRLPHQFDAFVEPVIDFVRSSNGGLPLRIIVFGCSNGAEPYSIASVLTARRPDVHFDIAAYDIEPTMIAKARSAHYTTAEVNMMAAIDPAFAATTFEERDGAFEVRPALSARCAFEVADVLDPDAIARIDPADIVVAQNFLYHLPRPQSQIAFTNLLSLLKPRAVLLVDGMDIDLRERLTRRADLAPLDYLIPEIHADARKLRGAPWPWQYWSVEPLDSARRDWKRRYATIFLQGNKSSQR